MKVGEAGKKECSHRQTAGAIYAQMGIEYKTECICGDCMDWEYTKHKSYGESSDTPTELPEDEKEGYCKRLKHE